MIINNGFAAAEQPVAANHNNTQLTRPLAKAGVSQNRSRSLGKVEFAAALALFLFGALNARSQPSGLQIIPLAEGYSRQHNVNLHAKGPSDVLQSLLVFQPGGDTGWHTHPGPVVVVVKSGALTEFHSNGCVTVHPAGSVFFETKDEVHRAVNQTGGVTEVYATFISPVGTQPLIPATDPGGSCRDEREPVEQ